MKWKGGLIGSCIEVVESKNKDLVGLKGNVIDETKNMIVIENGMTRKIIKSQVIIKIDGKIIDGKSMVGHLKDRIK
jgi:ribonuclease P protein subunit POP4